MEQKTMGTFLAALRKAKGMTQRELAEVLNVSDKSVSRWERDETAPDLALIPVIAEVFGVTCDELLRGERRPAAQGDSPSPKGERQIRRILTAAWTTYQNRSLIAVGISLTGLIAAMVGNFAFLRSYLGFLLGTVFYLAGAICQLIFVNRALLSVEDQDLPGVEVFQFKERVHTLKEKSLLLTVCLLIFSIPLVLLGGNHRGLRAGSWFALGAVGVVAALILWPFLRFLLSPKDEVCTPPEPTVETIPDEDTRELIALIQQKEEVRQHNKTLLKVIVSRFTPVLLVTILLHFSASAGWLAYSSIQRTTFDDLEEFVAYMEQDVPRPSRSTTAPDHPVNSIPVEEEPTVLLTDRNDDPLCEYVHRNQSVSSVRINYDEDGPLPITVCLYEQEAHISQVGNLINLVFSAFYAAEVAIAVWYYWKQVRK